MSGNKGRLCATVFSKGGRTTVEVLNPASSFDVGFPPYPPHLVLGRNLHSFGFDFYSLWGPGFPILNVGGKGGEVYQKRCRILYFSR